MHWSDLEKGDDIWINGEMGVVRSVVKRFENDLLTTVEVQTGYRITGKQITNGPRIFFVKFEKEDDGIVCNNHCPTVNLTDYFETDKDVCSYNLDSYKDNDGFIISLSEKNAKECKKYLEVKKKIKQQLRIEKQIEYLEDEIKTNQEILLRLREELNYLK